ncbi:hypothetical protein PL11_001715 [Lentilactobacillus curieae]|uniref:Gram-positive cocci surface proteins LPxTG domain-containing protein n=1 Tax=Lentilactobacillus curieae TaxID=1138822 RepID=A0A1S6QGJ3_9LACO|nr:hypothetical protein [Lentilactobacillus curieae]AQW20721.1 hypothetical protein PL11_001715 [Lentilactobacillus curieae]
MRKNLKWITVLCSTSAALLLSPVVSGGSTDQVFASSGGDSSTEVQYQKQTSVNESTNVDHAAKVEQYNESKTASTTSNDGTTTTTTYDSHPTNNQIGGTTADSSSVSDSSQNSSSSSATNSSSANSSTDAADSTGAAANQSSANKNSSSTGDGFAMVGAGKSGSAATGSTVEKGVKPVIDQLLPGGSLADSTPTVNQPNANTNTNASSTTGSTAATTQGQGQTATNGNTASQAAASQYLSQRGLGQVNGNGKKGSIKSPLSSALEISNNETAAKNKTKLVSLNAFSNALYKKVQKQKENSGKIVPASGKKATITTPTKNVRYSTTGQGATTVSESMPVIVTLSVIGIAVLGFIAFDPLRFIFR